MSAFEELEQKPREERTPLEQCIIDAARLEDQRDGDYTQMEAAAKEMAELRSEIAESNSLLRSTFSIAERDGDSIHWNAFKRQVEISLTRQFALMQKLGIKPT